MAVFDFDKTLIDADVAYLFLVTTIRRSKLRLLTVCMLTPLLLPLLLIRPIRFIAMGMLMWVATFPLRGKTRRDIFKAFASTVLSSPIHGRFYNEGLNALAAHRKMGHRLLILSGSPQDLVEAIVHKTLDISIDVIGSQIVPFMGGLVYRHYCMGSGKLRRAKACGLLTDNWDSGYSDSALDIPLLNHCRHRFLINPAAKTIKRVKAVLGDRFTTLHWTDPA